MITDSVCFLVGEGKRVVYDAEHFFDAWREDSGYALECLRAAVAAGAENVTLCDTNGVEPPAAGRGGDRRRDRCAGGPGRGRDPHPQRQRVRGRQLPCRRGRGGPAGPGDHERLRRAHRQREPGLDPSGAPAQDGLRVRAGRASAAAHRDLPFRRRALQPAARPRPAVRRPQRLCPQGRHARRRGQADARTFEHIDPGWWATAATSWSPSSPAGAPCRAAPRARASTSTPTRPSGPSSGQGARAPRLPVRGRRRLLRAAAAPGGRELPAALPARGLPRDHREARGRQGRDRGHDQDLG